MMPNTLNARSPLVSLFLLLALFVAMGDSTAGSGSSDGTQLKESTAGESEAEMAPPMEGNPTAHEPWNTGTGLRVLLAIPCFHFNRSHVNFALAFYRILRKQHSVHVLVPYAKDKYIEFLRKAANKDDRMNNDLEFFDLKNSQIKVQVERKEIGANGKPTGKKVESTEEFGDILKHPNFENDFEHYPVGWSSLPWKEVMASKYGIKEHGKHVPQNLSKYDVGIAEFSWPNRHALALFHALGIEHTIVTHAYTPESHNYQDLGMLEAVIKAHIPSVHNSKLGDIFLNKEHDFHDKTAELMKRYAEIKEVHSRDAVKITEDIVKQDEDFANIPGFANFKLLDAFYNADYYFANTISELEFDGGAVLKMSQQERLHEFHKMLNAQKKLNAHHREAASIDTSVQQRLPEVTMVGGVHIAHLDLDSKKLHEARLSEAIEEKLREHGTNKGIVLISFGSVLKTQRDLTHVHFEAIRAVIKQNPDLFFIWQLTEGDKRIDTVNQMSNAYADKWLDLVAILADHRLKAFLSHCGRNSQFEATKFGVPTICVPFFNDQFYNAVVTARSGRGTFLDFFCLELQNKQYELVVTQYHPVLETESTLAIEYDDSEDELHKKFLAMMQESLKQWDERETQKAPAEKAAHGSPFKQIAARNDCFTKANIHRTLHEAIDASNGHSSGTKQKTMLEKAHSSIEASKLKAAKDSIREHPAESVVMAAVKKISEKIKAKGAGSKVDASMDEKKKKHAADSIRELSADDDDDV